MSSRTDRRSKRVRRTRPRAGHRRAPWMWVALSAIVLVAAVAAVLATRGDNSTAAAAAIEQNRPVQVSGNPLPKLTTGPDAAVGAVIPELRGASFDGTSVDVTRNGQAKLVLFVAHWCPVCQREVRLLTDFLRTNPLPAGVQLVAVSTATDPNKPNSPPSSWLADERWPGPVLADSVDSAAAQAFGVSGFPYFVAVDGNGHVVERTKGMITTDQFTSLAHKALAVD